MIFYANIFSKKYFEKLMINFAKNLASLRFILYNNRCVCWRFI